ncbi:flavin reductase [Gulosibacter molinativorax]|uniref:Flavin reductase n=1 Tax=Gulosibacter molinativorax TaxID=256821 RepID=A0ABT7C6Q6_9MICO|nr:flavin reductase [Gulosibacter molinativorax]MDJ1370878.1 flavin reductase [Gulosibacter molinativorax]
MQQDIKDAVRHAWAKAWDEGKYTALRELVTSDYRRTSASSGRVMNLDDFINEIDEMRAAFPDMHTTIERIVANDDELAIFWRTDGTFTEPLGNVPPTGTKLQTHGSNFARIRDGKIAEEEVTWDDSALLRDLGLTSLASAFEEAPAVTPIGDALPPREGLKAFNKQFISGVTVVTTTDEEGKPRGLAVSAFSSVSLDPPLVLVCVQKTSSTYPSLFRSSHIGINALSSEQRETIGTFASKSADKFAEIDWHEGPNGSPLIDGSSASIEVEIKERFQALTHTIFIGRVQYAESTDDAPIIYKAAKFYDGRGLAEL